MSIRALQTSGVILNIRMVKKGLVAFPPTDIFQRARARCISELCRVNFSLAQKGSYVCAFAIFFNYGLVPWYKRA